MNKAFCNLLRSLVCAAVLLAVSCGGGKKGLGPTPEPTAAELTAEGWTFFEGANLSNAEAKFSQAISKDPNYADAYNGRGWCLAFQDQDNSAISDFNKANTKGLSKSDAYAGLAGVYVGNQEFTSAITNAKAALSMDSTYQFSHKTAINYLDLHLILAQAYYGLGGSYLDSAQQEVDYLNPANSLDPTDSATWVIDEVTYDTYAEALLKEIQRLEESIGGY